MKADAWRQAKDVLAEALVCAPAERDALVLAKCPDPSLRRQVQSYLDQYDEEFLESVLTVSETFDSTSPSAADEATDIPDIHPGDRIGPYAVIDRLGVGGMGHVFLGNDTRLHRKVALKCLIASSSRVDVRARILHEARAAARITHPNIAVVHDVIEHEGRPFLVMEYVEGESLAALIRRERLPLERILAIGRQLASALGAAHGKGIIHRDLKPANVQVMPDGSVKVLDFGVAQAMLVASEHSDGTTTATLAAPLSTTATLRTVKGTLRHPGTPAYMSPEQMFGKPIDQRSDIYSLGIMLYEMSAGHRPYSTDDPLELVLALSRNFADPFDGDLPKDLGDVVTKMLAVDAGERYGSAAEVESALAALIAPDPAQALPGVTRSRFRLRRLAMWTAVLTLIPVCIALLGFSETVAFNYALGRVPPFNDESVLTWLEFGARALVVPSMYQIAFLLLVAALRFVARLLSLSDGIEHLLTTGATRTRRLRSRLGLNNPAVLAQAIATVGLIALVVVSAAFWNVLRAWAAHIDTSPVDYFSPLRPGQRTAYQLYEFAQCVLIFVFTMAVSQIVRQRAASRVRNSGASLGAVAAMLAFSIVMLVLPYRIVFKSEFEQVEVHGESCFLLGEHDSDWLVNCPAHEPPRNRTVNREESGVRKTGDRRNIFASLARAR
jgi:serine/threonine protein kinase